MVVEVLAGVALARSAISAVKQSISTVKDVSEIAHHLEDLFGASDENKKKVAKKQTGKQSWSTFLKGHLGMEVAKADDTSLGAVAAEVIEHRQITEQINSMKRLVNRRFGAGTFEEIERIRSERIAQQRQSAKDDRAEAKRKAKENSALWHKILKETLKIMCVLLVIGALYMYLSWAYYR